MVGGKGARDAVDRARRLPSLGVGLHVVLVGGSPVSPPRAVPHLVEHGGEFSSRSVSGGGKFFLPPGREARTGNGNSGPIQGIPGDGASPGSRELPQPHAPSPDDLRVNPEGRTGIWNAGPAVPAGARPAVLASLAEVIGRKIDGLSLSPSLASPPEKPHAAAPSSQERFCLRPERQRQDAPSPGPPHPPGASPPGSPKCISIRAPAILNLRMKRETTTPGRARGFDQPRVPASTAGLPHPPRKLQRLVLAWAIKSRADPRRSWDSWRTPHIPRKLPHRHHLAPES